MIQKEEPSTNIWDYKPQWCQPWSILLTGSCMIGGSWFGGGQLLGRYHWWLTLPIMGLIGLWWLYFLVVVPRLFHQEMTKPLTSTSPPPEGYMK